MEYHTETLNRATGDYISVSLGHWYTVAELADLNGFSKRDFKKILFCMGLLQSEGKRGYRLKHEYVAQGYGKRITPKLSKYPFDVISPLGQRVIADNLEDAIQKWDESKVDPIVNEAEHFLASYKAATGREGMKTQEEISFLKFHYPHITQAYISLVLSCDIKLVSKYVDIADKQVAVLVFKRADELPTGPMVTHIEDPHRLRWKDDIAA